MRPQFGPRRATLVDLSSEPDAGSRPLSPAELEAFERLDLLYRALCAMMYNYVPLSGHPGGSISSGRFVAGLLFDAMKYDLASPDRAGADIISYAAGHKALGLYAMWALRNEIARVGAPELLPDSPRWQLRLEDLLGFRRNPKTATPLFRRLGVKPLDGHPTPATPFVPLSTGVSGAGVAASLGLAFAAADVWGEAGPRVHILEGEGGLTAGRVSEALAAAGTASLANAVLHVDWNQASIDSDRVCRKGEEPGDYVQWTPVELCYLHDWNVIRVRDGSDFQQIIAAQRRAAAMDNGQPTAIVYETIKGWRYGIEGRASHGAGHALCSEGFYAALAPLAAAGAARLPACDPGERHCGAGRQAEVVESCYWEALRGVRAALEADRTSVELLAERLRTARRRLDSAPPAPRRPGLSHGAIYELAARAHHEPPPAELALRAGAATTLRDELGRVLNWYNRRSNGAVLVAAADLLGSTSAGRVAHGFPAGFLNLRTNPDARVIAPGGICEDAMAGLLSGVAAYGQHLGVGSSYAAFLAPLGQIAARLHAIASQARRSLRPDEPFTPLFLVCAHAGLKTGEDGPTHADPQALQLLQESFPRGTLATLTPWDPAELWPLVSAALARRPAVIAAFVTRPHERVLDRDALGLAPAAACTSGVYRLRSARGRADATVVLQGSGVAYAFVEQALPLLERRGVELDVYYVASAELFDLLAPEEQERIFPEEHAREAIGITGFTLATLYRWVSSRAGRRASLHPFGGGRFLGSGRPEALLAEAGLDGESQAAAVLRFIEQKRQSSRATHALTSR